jgi:hypothetical protein
MRRLYRLSTTLIFVPLVVASGFALGQASAASFTSNSSSRKRVKPLFAATATTSVAIDEPMTERGVNGTLYPAACGGPSHRPSWCSGSDIGAWINAAVSALPAGVVSGPNYSNAGYRVGTIELPNANGMIWSTPVTIGPGTNLVGQGKLSSFSCTASSGDATVSKIVETSGNIVTLTVNSMANFAAGQSAYLRGLSVGTWLNGKTVILSSVTPTALVFNDPAGHGTQALSAETGNASLRATISKIVETWANVVTLTVSPAASTFAVGQDVYLSGLDVGTWLNSQTVIVSSVTGATVTFNDPIAHGAQASATETGNATPSVACLTVDHSASSGQFAHTVLPDNKIENFVLEGNGAAGQSVIKFKDPQGIEVHGVIADGATDAGQACFWLEDINWWTERNTFIDDSSGYNCNIGWRFTSEASTSPHPSFGYNRFLDIKFNTAGAQTAFSFENNSYVYSGTYRITGNKGGVGSIVWFMSGNAAFYENELQLQGEENGSGGYFLELTSSSNQFTYWGNIVWGGGTPNKIAPGAVVTHWLDSDYFTAAPNFFQNPVSWASSYTLPNGYDLNSVRACGSFEVTNPLNGPSVSPSNALLHLQVVCGGTAGRGYVEQIVYQANYTSGIPLVFQRNEDGAQWNPWYTVYNGTAGSANHAACWKAPGLIGYCQGGINPRGSCDCH